MRRAAETDAAPVVWRVVFCDPPPALGPRRWRDRLFDRALGLLKPGFRHVWLCRPSASGGWIVVNPAASGLDVTELAQDAPAAAWPPVVHVLAAAERRSLRWRLRPCFTCVEVAKHTLGLDAPCWIATPRALHRWLLRTGLGVETDR